MEVLDFVRRRIGRTAVALGVLIGVGAMAVSGGEGDVPDSDVVASRPDAGEAAPPPGIDADAARQHPGETAETSSSTTPTTTVTPPPACGEPSTRLGRALYTVSPSGQAVLVRTPEPDEQISRFLWSPDGQHLAYLSVSAGTDVLRVVDARAESEVRPRDQAVKIWGIEWLDDEHLVLAVREPWEGSRMRVLNVSLEGVATVLYEAGPQFGIKLAPAPDGRLFFQDDERRKLMVVNGDGSGMREIATDASVFPHAGPVVSPDSRHIAAIIDDQRTIIDSETGEQVHLGAAAAPHPRRSVETIVGWSSTGQVVAFASGSATLYRLDGRIVDLVAADEVLYGVHFFPEDQVVFSTEDGQYIEVADLDGSGRRPLVARAGMSTAVSGALITTQHDPEGHGQNVFVCWTPLDGSASRPLASAVVTSFSGGGPKGTYVAVLGYR